MIRIYPGSDDNGGCDVASEDYGHVSYTHLTLPTTERV